MTNLHEENEIWKDIPGWEGRYRASNLGRIFSIKKDIVLKPQGQSRDGYQKISMWIDGSPKLVKIHRLVALSFIENPGNRAQVNHKNGIKSDNRLANLEWCTNRENAIHAHNTGLKGYKSGSLNGNSTLTEIDVAEIKRLISYSVPGKQIARLFGVSKFSIFCIKTGKTWKHVKDHPTQPIPLS